MLSPRMVGAVAACVAVFLGSAAGARAASPDTWGPATALGAGTTSIGDQVLSSPTGELLRYAVVDGYPTVSTFSTAGLGTATRIPGAPKNAMPAAVAWLPDGSGVFSYYQFNTGPLRLIVRFPNGTFGPVYNLPTGAQSFAVRAGEVLVLGEAFFNVDQVTASSLAIAANGTMTPVGGAAVIYSAPGKPTDPYGTQIEVPIVALDADGQAVAILNVDHVSASGNEVLESHRDASGQWGQWHNLSAGLSNSSSAGQVKAAVAPGGRTLLSFQTNDGTLTKSALWRSLREPGAAFPAPTVVNDLVGAGGAIITTRMAAGGDGTLALAVFTLTCQTASSSEVNLQTLNALIAAPGKDALTYGVGVLDTAMAHSRLMSLGAGAGRAIVGINDQVTTAGNPDNVCQTGNLAGNAGTVSDRAALVGPGATGDHTFGTGSFNGNGNGSVMLSVEAGAINAAGDAAVTGRLLTSGISAWSFYEGPPVVPNGGPPPATTPTPPPPPPPPAPVNTASPVPNPGPFNLSSSGTVSFTLTAPQLSSPGDVLGAQLVLQVFSGRATGARAGSAKSRLIGSVRKTVRLRSKQKLTVSLKLTAKLRTYLKKHPKAGVQLQITTTLPGHRKTVTTRAVRLKRKG